MKCLCSIQLGGSSTVWFIGIFLVAGAVQSTWASQETLFRDVFATSEMSAWTLQPPVNALGPIPANGAWKTQGGWLVATGTAPPWTVQTAGEPEWTDYALSVLVTIRKPAPKADFPIYSAEFDRYMPREDFPPLCQHTGQYRYRYYAGEFDWGSDAAVLVRYQDRNACYRVQLSTEYQEMILWHGTGGYLQVVPCRLESGRTYKLEVIVQGARVQVLLDGEKKIDYWHECLPTLSGGIGLAAYNATVAFGDVTVRTLGGEVPPMPTHRARFSARRWRGLRWVFDGNEPIFLMEKSPVPLDSYLAKTLFYHFVKLRPGYRPLYFCWVSVLSDPHVLQLVGDEDAIRVEGEGTEQLTLRFDTETPEHTLRGRHTDVLTYDRRRGAYRHDITTDVTFLADRTLRLIEFCDPLTYNNKAPGRGVRYPWLPAGHEWGVFIGEDGRLYRHPISQSLNLPRQNGWMTRKGHTFWMLYPDRAVCPVWEHDIPGQKTLLEVCHWGYDWHQRIPFQPPRTFKAGERFTIRYAMTGCRPEEAERLFLRSELHPQNERLKAEDEKRFLMVVPSPYGYPVCDPAGTTFDQLYNIRVPYVGWQFRGDYTMDRQVGHTDNYSLRLDGPAMVNGMFYHHMIDGYARRYLCSFWLKTRGVRGAGVVAKLKYSYRSTPCDTVETGITGDTDWQEISFVTTIPVPRAETYDSSDFILQLNGTGTVWLDDFCVRPLEDGETVTEHRPARKADGPRPSADYLLYLPCDEGEGPGCYDISGHGHSAKLHGVSWVRTERRSVLRFQDGATAFVPVLSEELRQAEGGEYPLPGLTLEAWVRPAAEKGGGALIGHLNSPLLFLRPAGKDSFTLNLRVTCKGKSHTLTSKPIVAAARWSHVAATIGADNVARLYVNGQAAGEKALEGKITFSSHYQMISIGTYGKSYGHPYWGEMAEIRWWSRAATAEEIAAAAAAGQP